MAGKRGLPQCAATTLRGERCKAGAVKDQLCACHHPQLAPAWHQRNREATRRYWDAYRAMRALAASGGALD
jgi:hypothetical protein